MLLTTVEEPTEDQLIIIQMLMEGSNKMFKGLFLEPHPHTAQRTGLLRATE
jgi:hypothetical protein